MDCRKIEMLIPEQWVEVSLKSIKKGMTFRMFESTGEPVLGEKGSTIFIATNDCEITEDGIPFVSIEEGQ